jgi:hypothetical protein
MAVLILQRELRVPLRDMAGSNIGTTSMPAGSFCAPALPIETTCRTSSTSLELSFQPTGGAGPATNCYVAPDLPPGVKVQVAERPERPST